MNKSIILLIFFCCYGGNLIVNGEGSNIFHEGFSFMDEWISLQQNLESFEQWAKYHSKNYPTREEQIHRMKVWVKNHEFIEAHNSQEPKPSFTLGHNHFSDLTYEEFRELNNLKDSSIPDVEFGLLGTIQRSMKQKKDLRSFSEEETVENKAWVEETHHKKLKSTMKNLPPQVDWVQAGAVTPVKNQGSCGACWAFSTTGAIEGARFINTNDLISLSEQNLIDCDGNDSACDGGMMERAFQFDTDGICSEQDYPYEMTKHSKCNPSNCTPVPGTAVKYYIDAPEKSDIGLRASISLQPTSVALSTKSIFFQFYRSGVFNHDECGVDGHIDHGVLAVGYGHDQKADMDYYLIKNSWGPQWGEEGYIRVARNLKYEYGMCSILRVITTPVLKKDD